jgi:hypothetical protein
MTKEQFDSISWKKGATVLVGASKSERTVAGIDFQSRLVLLGTRHEGVEWVSCSDLVFAGDRSMEQYRRQLIASALPVIIAKGERLGWDGELVAQEAISYAECVIAEEKK